MRAVLSKKYGGGGIMAIPDRKKNEKSLEQGDSRKIVLDDKEDVVFVAGAGTALGRSQESRAFTVDACEPTRWTRGQRVLKWPRGCPHVVSGTNYYGYTRGAQLVVALV